MLEKAQRLKRKANLEENSGIQFNPSNVLSQNDILVLAKNMNIGINLSREPSNIIKKVVDLDRDRVSTFSSTCRDKECVGTDVEDTNTELVQGVAPERPPEQIKAQRLEELIEALSVVIPRKQITRKQRKMIGLLWNIRGLGLPGRIPILADKIRSNHVDFLGIMETKKAPSLVVFLDPLQGILLLIGMLEVF